MTTVAQMIEWMKTLPQDAIVKCGVEVEYGWYKNMEMHPVNIQHCDVFDYTSEEDCIKYPTLAGKVIVSLMGDNT
jgi:hypothetical protein